MTTLFALSALKRAATNSIRPHLSTVASAVTHTTGNISDTVALLLAKQRQPSEPSLQTPEATALRTELQKDYEKNFTNQFRSALDIGKGKTDQVNTEQQTVRSR